jgi:hypothetical protein
MENKQQESINPLSANRTVSVDANTNVSVTFVPDETQPEMLIANQSSPTTLNSDPISLTNSVEYLFLRGGTLCIGSEVNVQVGYILPQTPPATLNGNIILTNSVAPLSLHSEVNVNTGATSTIVLSTGNDGDMEVTHLGDTTSSANDSAI